MGLCLLLLSVHALSEASELGIKRFRYFMMFFKFQSYCQKLDHQYISLDFPGSSDSKDSACNAGDPGSLPGSGRFPGDALCRAGECGWIEDTFNQLYEKNRLKEYKELQEELESLDE